MKTKNQTEVFKFGHKVGSYTMCETIRQLIEVNTDIETLKTVLSNMAQNLNYDLFQLKQNVEDELKEENEG